MGYNFFYILDKFGISKSTISYIIKKHKTSGSLKTSKRSGRPKKTNEQDKRIIVRSCLNDPAQSTSQLASSFNEFRDEKNQISKQAIQRILYRSGLASYVAKIKPILTKRMVKSRIEFCKKYKDKSVEFWRRVIFSDETFIHINLGGPINRVRRFKSTNPLSPKFTKKTCKFPIKLMIWSCFCYHGFGRIQICESNMNSEYYKQTLETKLLPSIHDFGIENPIHLDDSARPHRTSSIIEWHDQNGIAKICWPGNSPDLNPIENLWAILKRKLSIKVIRNKRQLIENAIKVWSHEISSEFAKSLADSMPERIKKCLENKGYPTKY